MSTLWMKQGKLLAAGGKLLACDHCPCGDEVLPCGNIPLHTYFTHPQLPCLLSSACGVPWNAPYVGYDNNYDWSNDTLATSGGTTCSTSWGKTLQMGFDHTVTFNIACCGGALTPTVGLHVRRLGGPGGGRMQWTTINAGWGFGEPPTILAATVKDDDGSEAYWSIHAICPIYLDPVTFGETPKICEVEVRINYP